MIQTFQGFHHHCTFVWLDLLWIFFSGRNGRALKVRIEPDGRLIITLVCHGDPVSKVQNELSIFIDNNYFNEEEDSQLKLSKILFPLVLVKFARPGGVVPKSWMIAECICLIDGFEQSGRDILLEMHLPLNSFCVEFDTYNIFSSHFCLH